MKPIYGHWSSIATVWCALLAFDIAGGIFDLATMDTIWWLCFWQLALAIWALASLRHELRLLKAGREREQALIARREVFIAALNARILTPNEIRSRYEP
ncbi:MAG: hypothetical protein HIU88_10180 [Acidobacteria bacterium]|nr:hypothetical protein [Acidobacteriota bacterium]